jgi:predicted anti-sigma-YlaC factor YlaD
VVALLALAGPGCSIKTIAVNSIGNALASGTSSYATDEDPDLVREATPFGLKTIESLLDVSPRHEGLLLSACSGFTQYGYAFLQQDADFVEEQDLAKATALRDRTRKLYLRALEYGYRGLEVDLPGFREQLRTDPAAAVARAGKQHVPLLFWTANALGAAISLSVNEAELTADQSRAEAMMKRALALDETYEHGSIHDFFISYEGSRLSVGGSAERAREHLDRALALSKGRRVFPLVAYAETVAVAKQDRQEFDRVLQQALVVDPAALPSSRLANIIAQKRARWLQTRTEALFVE